MEPIEIQWYKPFKVQSDPVARGLRLLAIKLPFMHWSRSRVYTSVLLKLHSVTQMLKVVAPEVQAQLDAILQIFWSPGYIERSLANKELRFFSVRIIHVCPHKARDLNEQRKNTGSVTSRSISWSYMERDVGPACNNGSEFSFLWCECLAFRKQSMPAGWVSDAL
jgi:hypothetical protein